MKYVIGIDYGTQSCRAVLVSAEDGRQVRSHTVRYPHGTGEDDLVSVRDYDDALLELLEEVTRGPEKDSITGICADATSLTLVPLGADGRALGYHPTLGDRPHARIKLWKRHAAQAQADEAEALAKARGEAFLGRTGGSVSSEWTLPKLMETRDADPEVYAAIDYALDLPEYLTYRLTGRVTRSAGSMSFKGLWARDLGLPSREYLDALRPGLGAEYHRMMRGDVLRPGDFAGFLSPELCRRFGLREDVKVAAGCLDGHTTLTAIGALERGDVSLVLGTSAVLTVQSPDLHEIPDICGIAMDGLTPGLYGVDAGQCCAGDMLEWFIRHSVPASYHEEAAARGISVHTLLSEKAGDPRKCRLTVADWWNGSRNAPSDLRLRGAAYGLSLDTRAEDIYLAMLQGIACGTRDIMELCRSYGMEVRRIRAAGGIAGKNPLLMTQYANILGMPVEVSKAGEEPAHGAAMLAAVGAGLYPSPAAAYGPMGIRDFTLYTPDEDAREDYARIYRRSCALRRAARELADL